MGSMPVFCFKEVSKKSDPWGELEKIMVDVTQSTNGSAAEAEMDFLTLLEESFAVEQPVRGDIVTGVGFVHRQHGHAGRPGNEA